MMTRLTTTPGARRFTWSEVGTRVGTCRPNLVLNTFPYEGVREQSRIYLGYRDDPWTTESEPDFKEFYDLGADPYRLRILAYYREVSQATVNHLQDRLVRLRGCRAAENGS